MVGKTSARARAPGCTRRPLDQSSVARPLLQSVMLRAPERRVAASWRRKVALGPARPTCHARRRRRGRAPVCGASRATLQRPRPCDSDSTVALCSVAPSYDEPVSQRLFVCGGVRAAAALCASRSGTLIFPAAQKRNEVEGMDGALLCDVDPVDGTLKKRELRRGKERSRRRQSCAEKRSTTRGATSDAAKARRGKQQESER